MQGPHAPDVFHYLLKSELFSDAIAAGQWYPRWIPDLNGGYGYPEFVFYQPGYFYVSHLFSFVGAPTLRCAFALGVVALAGGLGAYRLIRGFAPRRLSWFFLLMFQLTPYHFTEIYARGDLSEWMALQLSPWPLYLLYRLTRTPADRRAYPWLVVGLGGALTCMGYAHPVTYVFFLPAFAAMACALGLRLGPGHRRSFFEAAFLGTLIGVTLSSPHWLAVVTLKPYVNSQAALGGHFDPLAHLLSPLAFVWSEADPLSQRLGLSFELGPVHFLLALSGAWLGRRDPFVLTAAAIYVALLVLMTPAGAPFWSLYPFYLMQFPWRLLAFSAVFQLICMLGLSRLHLTGGRREVVIALGLVVVTCVWHSDELFLTPVREVDMKSAGVRQVIAEAFPTGAGFMPFDLSRPDARDVRNAAANAHHAVPLSRLSTFDSLEWMPITALAHPLGGPRGEALLEPLTGSASIVRRDGSSRFKLDYAIEAATKSTIVIHQLYLPGWRVSLNGRDVSDAALRDQILADGRITVTMGPGTYRLRAAYDGPPGWRWRTAAMLAVTSGCILWLFQSSRAARTRERAGAVSPA